MAEIVYIFKEHNKDVNCCAFSSNSKILASSSGDKSTRLWDVKIGKELDFSPLIKHDYSVVTCAFSPFGSILATGSQDSNIVLWDADTGKLLNILQGHKGIIRCCVFSSNSQYLASASSDETIRVWDIKSYQLLRILRGPEFSLMTCRFTPDDLYIVSGSVYGDVRIWDFSSGNCENFVQAHDNGLSGVGITGCDFSPSYGSADCTLKNGQEAPCFLLATCGGDNLIKLWHVYTASAYSLKCNFELCGTLEEHSGHVWDCKFSINGKLLASCSSDKSVILWDPLKKTMIAKLSGHTRYVITVAFSPDCLYLATGSNDKTVIVWSIADIQPSNSSSVSKSCVAIKGTPKNENIKLIRTWSVDDACLWLHELGLHLYSESFRQNAIDGAELLQLTDDMLRDGLGIGPLGHRNKILRELKTLRTAETQGTIPDEFLCPITLELMSDPVLVADGFTYERSSITEWIISGKTTSPLTNKPLPHTKLIPNRSLKSAIMRYFGPAPFDFCI